MIRIRHYIIIMAALAAPIAAKAQEQDSLQVIERNVDVVNAYIPKLTEKHSKLLVDPVMDDTMSYKPSFQYQIISKVQTVTTTPDSLTAATMNFPVDKSPYKTMVKAAGGNYTSFLGELQYNIGNSDKYHLSLGLGHMSMLGKVKLPNDEKVKAPNNDTHAHVDFARFFKNTSLGVNMSFLNNGYEYYGLQTVMDSATYLTGDGQAVLGSALTDGKKQNTTDFSGDVTFGNVMADPHKKTSFRTGFGMGTFSNKTGVSQLDIRAMVGINVPFKENYLVNVMARVNYFKISVPDYEGFAYSFQERKHADVTLKPHFGIDYEHFQARFGLKMIFEVGDEKDDIFMQPDINVNLNIADGIVAMYAGMSGDYRANSFRDIVRTNRYVASDACNYVWKASTGTFVAREDMPTTQNPIKLIAGIRATFSKHVEMQLDIDYSSFDDELFFVNKGYQKQGTDSVHYTNMFGIMSENGKLFKAHGELNIKPTSTSSILLAASYYKWKLDYIEEPWYRPTYEIELGTRFRLMDSRLLVTASAKALGDRYAYNQTLKAKEKLDMTIDVNIGAEYFISSRWSAFVNFNNVAAADYQQWLGYSSFRFHAMGGITYKF